MWRFFWDKILSMSKDLRKKNRLLNKTLFVQLFDTFVTVVGSFWYLEHGFSLVNFLLTSQKEARPVDLAYPGNSWLVGSPKGETFCRETPQLQKRKRSKPWFAETEKGPNFSRKFIPACCKVARNCFGLTFWVTWRWRRMGPFPPNWPGFGVLKIGGQTLQSQQKHVCGTLDTWSLIHVTSSRSPPGSSFGLGGHVIHVCLERLSHIFPPSERFLWPSKWQSAGASVNLPWGQRWGHELFHANMGVSSFTALDAVQVRSSFALIQAQGRMRTMTFPVIRSQWHDWMMELGLDGYVMVGCWVVCGFQLGMAVAQKFTTCVDPKQWLKNIRPKGSETETSVICGPLVLWDYEGGISCLTDHYVWNPANGTVFCKIHGFPHFWIHWEKLWLWNDQWSHPSLDGWFLWLLLTSDNHQIPIIPAAPSWFWGWQPKSMALKILIFKFPRFVFRSVCSKGISDAFRDLHPNQQTRAKGEVIHQKTSQRRMPISGLQW